MNKYIASIERRKDGGYEIRYYDQGSYKFRIFYDYSKRDALKRMRSFLGIKRNPLPIRDYTITPKTPLIEGLLYLANLRDKGINTILK